ncbi:MAG: N-6 DNA methylase [Bacteroidetes bacterium]|nr:N-6 DNA methylase [Bacteroidota bacterium]
MNQKVHNQIVSFIWSIADDVLRDVFVRGKYRDIILPFTVLRRLDALLVPTKDKVLEADAFMKQEKIDNKSALQNVTAYPFWNTSKFTFETLLNDADNIDSNLETYLDGYSPNVQEIISKFKLRNQLETMKDAGITYLLIDKLCNKEINLSPNEAKNSRGETLPPLTNLGMGYVFEELIRKFNEENNEEAGEHFTPREIIKLMTHILFLPVKDKIKKGTYLIYDPACGSGGMLTEAEHFALDITQSKANFELYGQEVNPETYAICTSDMLIKGENANNIKYGSTLSKDGFPHLHFDFMLSNPPYGKTWKLDVDGIVDDRGKKGKETIKDPRFQVGLPTISDGQLLFLMNMISKMKHNTELGSRIASVHNGSSLFTGDAGSGESEIRKWIIENDWLEAIISLPQYMFYNTEINTYIWILSNRKPEMRKGKVQLIKAVDLYSQMIRSMGKKSFELLPEHIETITNSYLTFEENENSKIISNENFAHYQVTIERPLRLSICFSHEKILQFKNEIKSDLESVVDHISKHFGNMPLNDFNLFIKNLDDLLSELKFKISPKEKKLIIDFFSYKDATAQPVVKKVSGKIVEYERDSELKLIEKIPFGIDIDEYYQNEILPYAPDSWIVRDKIVKGYQIHFDRFFNQKTSLRRPIDIEKEFIDLEEKRLSYLGEIFVSDPAFVKIIQQMNEKLQLHRKVLVNDVVLGKNTTKNITGFKKSKNPWFDEIPEHWQEHRAKWIFKNHSVKGYPNEPLLSVTQGKGAIPRDEYENRVVMPLGELMSFKLVEPGDFIISLRSFQGGIEYSHHRGIISPAYTVLKNTIEIHKPYFKHLLKCDSLIQSLNTAITGIREGKNINYDDFADIILPFPPIEEQIEIAMLLDEKLPNIDLLIEAQLKQVDLFKEQKKIIIDEGVNGKLSVSMLEYKNES